MGLLFQSWSQHLCVPISSSAFPQGVLTGNDSWKCVLKQRPGDWGPSETEAVPRKQRWFTSWGHRCRGCLGITWEHHLLLREASETGLRALPLQAGRHRGIWGMVAEKQGSPPCEPRRVSGEPPLARSPSRSMASQRICAPSGPPLPRVWCFCPRSAWTHTEEAPGRAAEKRDCDRAPCSWVRTSHSVRGLSLFGGCNVGLGVSTFSLVLSPDLENNIPEASLPPVLTGWVRAHVCILTWVAVGCRYERESGAPPACWCAVSEGRCW